MKALPVSISYASGPVFPRIELFSGFRSVVIAGEVFTSTNNVKELEEAVLIAMVEKRSGWTSAEVRFARTRLGLTQSDLAVQLGVQEQTVSLWERDRAIPAQEDALLRDLVLSSISLHQAAALRQQPAVHWIALARLPAEEYVYEGRFVGDAWSVLARSARGVASTIYSEQSFVVSDLVEAVQVVEVASPSVSPAASASAPVSKSQVTSVATLSRVSNKVERMVFAATLEDAKKGRAKATSNAVGSRTSIET